MNGQQLAAYFEAHKPLVLGGAAAGVAALAVLQRRKKAAAPAGASAGAAVPGTIPAAAVVPATGSIGGAYDSSSYDTYNAMQPILEQILQTTSQSGITKLPDPVASNLFAPTASGKYVQLGSSINEVESDGSMYGLSPTEWDQLSALPNRPANFSFQILGPNDGTSSTPYSTKANLLKKNPTS